MTKERELDISVNSERGGVNAQGVEENELDIPMDETEENANAQGAEENELDIPVDETEENVNAQGAEEIELPEQVNREKVRRLYFLISWSGIVSFFILLLLKNVDVADWLVMEHNYSWQFSDFFRQIIYASDLKNIYFNTGDAPFPPFAYIFFHLIYKMNPVDAPIELGSWWIVQSHQYNLLIFLMFMAAVIIFFVEAIKRILHCQESSPLIFIFSILLSAPFMSGAIERGNIALVVCVLLLWAMFLKDSEIPWQRELALILIAASAGLKIYPAIFGVLYLKEKRWKEAARLLLYGILFFFVPFAFTGGIAGIKQYMSVIGNFGATTAWRWTNVRCFWFALMNKFGHEGSLHVGMLLENIYLLLCLISMWKTKSKWKQILFLSGILSLYVSNSFRYVSVYMCVPLVVWFGQQKGKWNDYIYGSLFSLIFTIPVYSYSMKGEVDFCIFFPIYLLMFYSILETWFIESSHHFKIFGQRQ